jgi:putative redox protein
VPDTPQPDTPQPAAPQPAAPVVAELEWQGGLRFLARSGDAQLVLDSPPRDGPNPVQALVCALAGCMAMDVAHVMHRGRLPMRALRARAVAGRAGADPRRLETVDLRFTVEGAVPPDRVAHAIALSREKYCSVWHSLRPDIELTTSFEVLP